MFRYFAACRVTASVSKSITRWKPGSMAGMSASDVVWVSRVSVRDRTTCGGHLPSLCCMFLSSLPAITPPFVQPISWTWLDRTSCTDGSGSAQRASLPRCGLDACEPDASTLRSRYRNASHGRHTLSTAPRASHHAQCDDFPHCDARGPPCCRMTHVADSHCG